jgi:hypothetical protein
VVVPDASRPSMTMKTTLEPPARDEEC